MISVSLFAVQDSATKIPVSEAITKGYYVKAKHLATVGKIDVHKGEPACEGLWKGGWESSRPGWCQNAIH